MLDLIKLCSGKYKIKIVNYKRFYSFILIVVLVSMWLVGLGIEVIKEKNKTSFIIPVDVQLINKIINDRYNEVVPSATELIKSIEVKDINKTHVEVKESVKEKVKLKIEEYIPSKSKKLILSRENKRESHSIYKEISRGFKREIKVLDSDYIGEWKITFYTISKKECGKTDGITASGNKVTPYVTCAIDKKYWKFGNKFYVDGFGTVIAEDIGGSIKGRHRMDIYVDSVKVAYDLGVGNKIKVWKVND